MSWRGALRSLQAAVRAAERDARRRHRQRERRRRALDQASELERAAHEVALYRDRLVELTSVHKEGSGRVDWQQIAQAPPPSPPGMTRLNESAAVPMLEAYRPTLWTRLLGRAERVRAQLREKVATAGKRDDALYRQACANHEKQRAEWVEEKNLATRVLGGDANAYMQVLQELKPFSKIADLGSRIRLKVLSSKVLSAEIEVRGESAIPQETKRLLESGKPITEPTPKAELHRLYREHVCSCALRVARELFALLPVEAAVVTAVDGLVNSATGQPEQRVILSVIASRTTFDGLNLDRIDPSESMKSFTHRMDFEPTRGFAPVERVAIEDLPASPPEGPKPSHQAG
jgi:hypothetical protein